MANDMGSMEVKGIFRDMNLLLSLRKVKEQLKGIGHQAKSVGTDMVRLTAHSKKLQGILALLGAFSFFSLLASAPRISAYLERIRSRMEQIANIMDKFLSPAVKWLAEKFEDLYHWFRKLDPELQKMATYATVLGFAFGATALAALGASIMTVGLKGTLLALKGMIVKAILALTGPAGLIIALGLVTLALAKWAMDKSGAEAWVQKMIKRFNDAADAGNGFAAAIRIILTPITMLKHAIEAFVKHEGWGQLKDDFAQLIRDVETLTKKYEAFLKLLGMKPTSPTMGQLTGGIRGAANRPGYADNGGETIYAGSYDVGGMVGKDGLYWLQAGETVSKGDKTEDNSRETTIINQITGNTFMMGNGMDVDAFAEMLSRKQARDAKRRYS